MKVYLLVEGKRTERKIYPHWLSYLIPDLKRMDSFDEDCVNGYFLVSGFGYPHLLDEVLPDSIEDINKVGDYNYFVIVLDSEEFSIQERKEEVNEFLSKKNIYPKKAEIITIIQNRCIETWLLGNRKIISANPTSILLREYLAYYNVKEKDPELMGEYVNCRNHADFHFKYLKEIFVEKNLSYSKTKPGHAKDESYLGELVSRLANTGDLNSFRYFIDFCKQIHREIN